jgi:hypothetical protein
VKAKPATDGHGRRYVRIDCPGCGDSHVLPIEGPSPAWGFNGDFARPTLTPSILARSGHHVPGHAGECWCTWEAEYGEPSPFACYVCHSFVTEGRIQFCGDSTHALAGQTVDLPDIEEGTA